MLMVVDKKTADTSHIPSTVSIYNSSWFVLDTSGAVAVSSGIPWAGSHVSGSLVLKLGCRYKNGI